MENKSKFISELFEDLSLETYYGFNFKLTMYDEDEEVLVLLRNLVDRAKKERNK
jgi:hypothetical protein